MTLTLYSMPSSGNSYKVRLLLALLRRPYRHVPLEYETADLAEAHAAGRLPLSRLPVLDLEDGIRLPESNAILCYLAEGTDWLPPAGLEHARVLAWMFWEQNQVETTIAVRAALRCYPHRAHLATPERMAELLARGDDLFAMMEARMSARDWIATDTPSVADLALYAYTHSAESRGGYDLAPYPGLRRWLDRIAALPGHVGLEELPA